MQRKKQSATLSQLALHFAVFTPNCIKLRSLCQNRTPPVRVVFFLLDEEGYLHKV